MSIKKLDIEGAAARTTKSHKSVSVTLTDEAGATFKIGGKALQMQLRPQIGAAWEAETSKWLARWGEAAQMRDNPDLEEDAAEKLGRHRMQAMAELTARSIEGWNIPDTPATLDNRVDLVETFPAVRAAVEREVRRITREIEEASGN